MREYLKFYIDGKWVDPVEPKSLDVDNPTTEQVSGKIVLGAAADVDKAVKAARKAFATWSQTSREERLDVLQAILAEYQKRAADLADAVSEEMGAPASLAAGPQVNMGLGHLATAIDVLKNFEFEEQHGSTLVVKELHDQSAGLAALVPQAAAGVGWGGGGGGSGVSADAVWTSAPDTLVLHFPSAIPTDGYLYYGYGYGRLAATDQPGQGNAIYDLSGLPVWTPAVGVKVNATAAASLLEADPATVAQADDVWLA